MVEWLLRITLALITLGLGFSVGKENMLAVLKKPKVVSIGLISQMILLPIVAFLICLPFQLSEPLFFGIMIIAFCPGGSTANLVSFILKANVGLSITLSIVNGFICLTTIPLFISATLTLIGAEEMTVSVPYVIILRDLILLIIIPSFIGITLNHYFRSLVEKIQTLLRYLLPFLLALVFGIKAFADNESGGIGLSSFDISTLLLPLLLINAVSMLLGFAISKLLKTGAKNSLTISIETGLQNTALALLIASSVGSIEVQKPALVYAVFSFFTSIAIAWLIKKGLILKNEAF